MCQYIHHLSPFALFRSVFAAAVLAGVLSACSSEPDPRLEEETFTRIYDNSLFNLSVSPIDVQQTEDGGYLILSDRELTEDIPYAGVYLIKVDEKGNFVSEIEVEDTYVHPVGRLMEDQGSFYFFCMNRNTVGANLARVDANAEGVEFMPVTGGDHAHTYPLAADKDNGTGTGNFILLCYDHEDKASVLSVVTTAATIDAGTDVGVSIGLGDNDDVDELLVNHFNRTGRHFPFQVGHIPGSVYFFNGFEDYTLTLVFTNFNDDDPIVGKMNGNQENAGFNTVVNIASTKYAAAWFNFDENYLLPNLVLNPSAPSGNVTGLGGYKLPELVQYATVKIMRTTIDEENVLIFGSDTKTNQIGLFFYNETSGEFMGSKYLGFSNPFEIASMTGTADEGLAVCGTTYLAGRFPRICLFKLSKDDLKESIN